MVLSISHAALSMGITSESTLFAKARPYSGGLVPAGFAAIGTAAQTIPDGHEGRDRLHIAAAKAENENGKIYPKTLVFDCSDIKAWAGSLAKGQKGLDGVIVGQKVLSWKNG